MKGGPERGQPIESRGAAGESDPRIATVDASGPAATWIVRILIVAALSIAAGRIAVVRSESGEVPFLSANDRSRWCTIAALVDDGTYQIDRQLELRGPHSGRRVWYTIDLVRHRGEDGQQHYYSSKPPLYPTLVAGVYAAVRGVTGTKLEERPLFIGRIVLACVNLTTLAIFLAATASVLRRAAPTPFALTFSAAAMALGTLLLPFTITLNNHLPAAAATAVALWALLPSTLPSARDDRRHGPAAVPFWRMFLAGLAAGFAAANELPALSMVGLWGLLALWHSRSQAFTAYLPGVLLVAAAFFATNHAAHGSLRPPYMHRGVGPVIAAVAEAEESSVGHPGERLPPPVERIAATLRGAGIELGESVELRDSHAEDRLEVWDPQTEQRFALRHESGGWILRHWDDWYDYPGTYWSDAGRRGIDLGERSRAVYAFHVLIGHHGIFSLSPIWLLSLGGAGLWWRRGDATERVVLAAIVTATLLCLAFYLARPLVDRNYGGISAGFRWMLWFAPLWLWLLVPAADRLGRLGWGRWFCLAVLAVSVFSATTPLENPWSHPWLYRYLEFVYGPFFP